MAAPNLSPQTILVVEDNQKNALLLQQVLTAEGHRVELARNGLEALDQVATLAPDLILLDLDMPYVDGFEVCRQVKSDPATQLIPIVIVTAQNSPDARMRAWELGADDFLTKPFQCIEVVARCRSLLRVKRLVDERDSAEAVVFAFARAVEAKSPYTQGHAERVAAYALTLAAEIGTSEEDLETLRKGATLHDIGKISVPDAILDKAGPLTREEFEKVKLHTMCGAKIVQSLRSIRSAVPMIRWHHERLDGGGYPDGLRDDDIPPLVRMLSVADVYDSLSSARPYRGPIPHQESLQILRENAAGGGLDPNLVESFCELFRAGAPTDQDRAALIRQHLHAKVRAVKIAVPVQSLSQAHPLVAESPLDADAQPVSQSDPLIQSWSRETIMRQVQAALSAHTHNGASSDV
jgi:putative two-component system response regulator